MKRYLKNMALLLVFAMIVSLFTPAMTTQVKAAVTIAESDASSGPGILIDFNHLNMSYTDDGVRQTSLFWITQMVQDTAPTEEQIAKVKENNWIALNTDDVTSGHNVCDISWFNKKKTSYAVVRYKNAAKAYEYVYKKIDPAPAALKVGFSLASAGSVEIKKDKYELTTAFAVGAEGTGYLFFAEGDNLVTPQAVVFRKDGSPVYEAINTSNFPNMMATYKEKGAKLYFTKLETANGATNDGWVAAEAKYTYAKVGAAPAVKIDVTKYTIGLKDTQEYRIVDASNETKKSDWISLAGRDSKELKKLTVCDLVATGGNIASGNLGTLGTGDTVGATIFGGNVRIDVRAAAVSGNKAKLASLYSSTYVTCVAETTNTIVDVNDTTTGGIDVEFTVPYNKDGGIDITNNTADEYEYAIVASGSSMDADTKWFKLKGAASKPVQIKGNSDRKTNYNADDNILIRKVGDKKNNILAGKAYAVNVSSITATQQLVSSASITGATAAEVVSFTATNPAVVTVSCAAASASGASISGTLTVNFENGVPGRAGSLGVDKKSSDGLIIIKKGTLAADCKSATFAFEIKDGAKAGNLETDDLKFQDISFKVKIQVN